jgi:hypothetical protein
MPVAAIPTSTQNGYRHTYIYSKRLPPSHYWGEEYSILNILSIRLSEAAVHQKNLQTVPTCVHTLGYTSYSENGKNEWKQKSLSTKAHQDTQLAYTMVLSDV